MSIVSKDEPIHIQQEDVNAWDTITNIANSKRQENPFYVCDVNDLVQKCKTWKAAMPRVKPHYAVKCNDHPVVLKTMAALGLGFDCASKLEIDKVMSVGVNPSRVIYSHTIKPPSHLRHAAKVKVDLMTFDNEIELHKIKKTFPNARTIIRIKYDAKAAHCLGLKFGCDPHSEAPKLLAVARDLELNVVGVSFHVGWGCKDPSAFYGAIAASHHVFGIASTMGYDFKLLDIGGGYPGRLGSSIAEYGEVINLALENFFPSKSVEVISEPGTYFVESAFTLACNIITAKRVVKENSVNSKSNIQYMYYLNDGVFGSLVLVVSNHVSKVPYPLKDYPGSKMYPSIIWGPTCNSTDKIAQDILLPEMQTGDWVIFRDMGAYSLSLWTSFNNFEPSNVYSIVSPGNWLQLRNRAPFVETDFVIDSECDNSITKPSNIIKESCENISRLKCVIAT